MHSWIMTILTISVHCSPCHKETFRVFFQLQAHSNSGLLQTLVVALVLAATKTKLMTPHGQAALLAIEPTPTL